MRFVRAFRQSWVGRQLKGLGTAILDTWFYSAAGTVLGLSLVIASEHLANKLLARISEHLGMGLVVSAIAVVLYEWRSDKKKAFDLVTRLTDLLAARGEDALDRALAELLGGDGISSLPEGAQDVSDNCRTLIVSIAGLLRRGNRVNAQYASFVSSLLRIVVSKNAQALKNLGSVSMVPFSVPANAAIIADDIFAAQMAAMSEGDRYDVISDLLSWQANQLKDFEAATRISVQRGVTVRRIFNLLREENSGLKVGQVKAILAGHLDAMRSWQGEKGGGGYEARLIGLEEVSLPERNVQEIRGAHFGVFWLGDEDQAFQFSVVKPDLSEIMIRRDLDRIREDLKMFEELWEIATPIDAEVIERVSCAFDKARRPRRVRSKK